MAQTPINNIIFSKTVKRSFRCIYVNCLNRLRFLAEVSTKLQNMHFFGQYKDNSSGRKHGNVTPFFSFSFSALKFYIWKWSKFFSCGPLLDLFWSAKYLNFGQRLPIQTAHHTLLESSHPEVTKYPCYVLWSGEPKKVSAHGLIPVWRGAYIPYFKIIPPIFCYPLQGRSEGTAFEVLIINCQICFINLFIFNCLILNIKLFIFKLFDVKFLFSENHVFLKQKRTAVYGLMDASP